MEADWGRILVVLWALWLRRNEVVFKGRAVLLNGVEHDVGVLFQVGKEGLVMWNRGQYDHHVIKLIHEKLLGSSLASGDLPFKFSQKNLEDFCQHIYSCTFNE